MKIALDIHGVISEHPKFFAALTKSLIKDNHQIHILTGSEIKEKKVKKFLKKNKIKYTHLFSIADHHRKIGTPMTHDKNGNPWLSDKEWDKTKGDYCAKHNISLCFDDTERYGKYFSTPFVYTKFK